MGRCVPQAVDTVGEILLSLSYLPTAERLTVVVVKAKNLVWSNGKVTAGERRCRVGAGVPWSSAGWRWAFIPVYPAMLRGYLLGWLLLRTDPTRKVHRGWFPPLSLHRRGSAWLTPGFPLPPPRADPFVKVYLLQDGRKISKKKTAVKRDDTNPVFNEAMIFSVPAIVLQVCPHLGGMSQPGGAHPIAPPGPQVPALARTPWGVGGSGGDRGSCGVVAIYVRMWFGGCRSGVGGVGG